MDSIENAVRAEKRRHGRHQPRKRPRGHDIATRAARPDITWRCGLSIILSWPPPRVRYFGAVMRTHSGGVEAAGEAQRVVELLETRHLVPVRNRIVACI